jgi:2'-5' RNA ligase
MRLFVALNLPATERQRIHESTRRLREGGFPVRWVEAAQIHLTVKFLGHVEDARAGEMERAVRGAARKARPFELRVGGVGAFPNLRNPRVVWIGVQAAPELNTLYEELEDRFAALGFERETRAFHPHLTLGRAKRGARAAKMRGLDATAAEVRYRSVVPVATLDLMESHVKRSGAEYEVRLAAPLGPAAGGAEGS